MKSSGWPRPPTFDRLESFGHDDFTAKHCYFGCSRPPDVAGIKVSDKADHYAKHCSCCLNICGLVILIKNFDPVNIKRPSAPIITMFCNEVIMIKT